ncbi:MAG: pyrroline-5-carboxylate reductase, partial [Gemmatimonadetes bacterium]|nr:pyrroline-5-carboxylate reductase [Gemmatimonadota bacterium]
MSNRPSVAILGAGAMGEVLAGGLLRAGWDPSEISLAARREERRREVEKTTEIATSLDPAEAAADRRVVIVAVKPGDVRGLLEQITGSITSDQIVISLAAGVTCAVYEAALGEVAVVRAMPNTPAQIGEGMTVWTATPEVNQQQQAQAQAILKAMGQEIYVAEERALDMATAVSGTGPTYVFLMMEAMTDAAVHLGFSRRVAKALVIQTVLGSALFALQSSKHLAELRNMVTSPGGTSADAIYQLEKGSLRTILSKAIWAAYQKSLLLGEQNSITSPER